MFFQRCVKKSKKSLHKIEHGRSFIRVRAYGITDSFTRVSISLGIVDIDVQHTAAAVAQKLIAVTEQRFNFLACLQ
jgi:hypothetical protein